MHCPKCKGIMWLERLSDFFSAVYLWKCLACGNRTDNTIQANQRAVHGKRRDTLNPQSHVSGAR